MRPNMGTTLSITAVIGAATLLLGSLSACDQIQLSQRNDCPPNLTGLISPNESGSQWDRADKVAANARITSIAVECIPEHHPPTEVAGTRRGPFTDYRIAAAARVTYSIGDKRLFDEATHSGGLSGSIAFEALSQTNVVLGSGVGSFKVIPNATEASVSASIDGLSEEEIKRTTLVQVRWNYR